ncbi:MAG: hypothetical protein AB1714_03475 [Acidobacteriota bacterium]
MFVEQPSPPRFHRILRAILLAFVLLNVPFAVLSGIRAALPPKVTLRLCPGTPPVVDIDVTTPGRGQTEMVMEIVEGGRRSQFWRDTVPSNPWASINPLPMHRHYEVTLPSNLRRGAVIRVTAIRPMMWLWRGAPVIREVVLPGN